MIIEGIRRLLNKEKRQDRQLQVQHANRFYKKSHWVHSFFVDEGYRAGLSGDMKKEALKYITRIVDMGVSTSFEGAGVTCRRILWANYFCRIDREKKIKLVSHNFFL